MNLRMKFKLSMSLALAFSVSMLLSCTSDEEQAPASQGWVPSISRSVTASSATIAGFKANGSCVFHNDLSYDGTTWNWINGVSPSLGDTRSMVCLLPALNSTPSTRSYYEPLENSRLQWSVLDVSEQAQDNRFYFHNLSHRVAQMRIELDRYFNVDEVKVHLAKSGYFNCLTGMFDEVGSVAGRTIVFNSDGNGKYVYTFTIVPQTFKAGATLLTYKDVYSDGYYTYHYKADRDVAVGPNQRLTIKTSWNKDWEGGSYTETKTNVALSVTVADWEVNETIDGSASENN